MCTYGEDQGKSAEKHPRCSAGSSAGQVARHAGPSSFLFLGGWLLVDSAWSAIGCAGTCFYFSTHTLYSLDLHGPKLDEKSAYVGAGGFHGKFWRILYGLQNSSNSHAKTSIALLRRCHRSGCCRRARNIGRSSDRCGEGFLFGVLVSGRGKVWILTAR